MGYTHYLYYTVPELDAEKFSLVAADFKSIIPTFEHLGFKIGDGHGQGEPLITESEIYFNGLENCGHPKDYLGLVWPSENASGISSPYGRKRENVKTGKWFAGLIISARQCDGDCSYETFHIEQKPDQYGQGLPISFCNTNFKPYDFAVNVCMIIAKHYLGEQVAILSDGTLEQWKDAIQFCEHFLGYGLTGFDEIPEDKPKTPPKIQTTVDQVKPGDIYENIWGYDQTNIDYYKVIKTSSSGKTCIVEPIQSQKLEDTGFMSERVVPNPDKPKSDFEWYTDEHGVQKNRQVVRQYRASIRYEKDGKIWLRSGNVPGSGYLHKYESPSIATHYA